MDRLYDNLDNYEDENIVAELRRENGELKCKLDEYSVAIDKLQKDFDTLSSEFKKLEMNYSSLLKTAKEEIERKTQIIKNLNIEKDMMVLSAIQNRIKPNIRGKGRYMPMSKSRDGSFDVNKTKPSDTESNNTREKTDNERTKLSHMSSEETMTSASTDIVTQCTNKTVDRLRNTYQDAKENNETNVCKTKPKPMSISSRRKSMPAIRSEVKFSSDEDEDSYCSAGNKYQKINHNIKPQNMLKTLHDKNRLLDDRHRTSETSSMDDKFSNYHARSKDFRTRSSRYDSYRNRDKFDARHKRHASPERLRRSTRNYSNEHNTRDDYTRNRILESPPLDRYNSHQRRNRDARSRYDNNEFYHKEKNRDRSQDNYSAKHKLQHDIEEPLCKRRRNDSTHNRDEEKEWDTDRGSVKISASVENISHMYCQSPDYAAIQDTVAMPPIREIRNTASTQLEDPRFFSNRYVSNQGNKGVLSTVPGRNVDLKVIETSNWGIDRVEVPKALTRRPSQCSENLVHNIYMDIDNPVSNMSLESGEIPADDLDIFKTHQSLPCKPQDPDQDAKSIRTKKYSIVHVEKQPIEDFSDYTIPKLRKEPKDQLYLLNNKPSDDTKRMENEASQEICSGNIPKIQSDLVPDNMLSENELHEINIPNNGLTQRIELTSAKLHREHLKPTINVTIEGDLELSDETNDNNDLCKKFAPDNQITTFKDVPKSNKVDCSQIEAHRDTKMNADVIIKENTKSVKAKRKTQKSLNKESAKKEKTQVIVEKRTRTKRDKKEPKEIKEKFSELFGDTTSSLITPEDLGIPAPKADSEPSDKYVPICEDAQDVVLIKFDETKAKTAPISTLVSCDTKNMRVDNRESEILEERNTDQINDTKKKKSKKKEVDKIVSVNNNENRSEPTHDSPSEVHAKTSNIFMKNQTDAEKIVVTKVIENAPILKPDLLTALATSTPYKEIKETPVAIGTSSPNIDCISTNFKHDIVVSVDDSATDQFSNNETLDSQTEVDAPDVRIFVKRRRKIIRKSKP